MPLDIQDLADLLRLLREHAEWREPLRSLLLTEDLLALPGRFERLVSLVGESVSLQQEALAVVRQLIVLQEQNTENIRQLVTAQQRAEDRLQRAEERLAALAAAQQRTEERLAALIEAQQRTEEQLRQLTEQVHALVTWQRGEAGRRDGERYEREIIRRAPFLFVGGEGGTADQLEVRRRLTKQLGRLLAGEFRAEDDPFLADLLWWKGERLAVVEVSVKVNGEDVLRATRRAATLRQAGAAVTAVVIGEEWATTETREHAQALGVEWKIGSDLSPGLLAFRQLPAEDETG